MRLSRAPILLLLLLSTSVCNSDSDPAAPVSDSEMGGLQLGMSPEEVEAKLKEFDPNIRIETISRAFNYKALGRYHSTDPQLLGLVGQSNQGNVRVQISAGFSYPPNPPQAVMVSRSDVQRTAAPSEEDYVAALIERYGQPTRDYIGAPSRGTVLPRVMEWPIAGGTHDCDVRLGDPGEPILHRMVQDGQWTAIPTPEFAQNCASVFRYTLTGDPVTSANGVIADIAAMAKSEFEAQAWVEKLSAEKSQAVAEKPEP